VPNLLPPLALDAAAPSWPVERADAVMAINMIHIAPWRAAEGLMAGAARVLAPGGILYLYGPTRRMAATQRRATPPSTPPCGRATRNGACATGRGARAGRRAWARFRRTRRHAGDNLSVVFRRAGAGEKSTEAKGDA